MERVLKLFYMQKIRPDITLSSWSKSQSLLLYNLQACCEQLLIGNHSEDCYYCLVPCSQRCGHKCFKKLV